MMETVACDKPGLRHGCLSTAVMGGLKFRRRVRCSKLARRRGAASLAVGQNLIQNRLAHRLTPHDTPASWVSAEDFRPPSSSIPPPTVTFL